MHQPLSRAVLYDLPVSLARTRPRVWSLSPLDPNLATTTASPTQATDTRTTPPDAATTDPNGTNRSNAPLAAPA